MANKVTRKIKNVVKQYTFAEVKIREATSNDPGGPTPKQLDEIAELSYHAVAVVEILGIIWKRLSDGEKQWRHLYKSLIVLDHLVKCGSEKVALYSQEKIDLIKQLNNIDLYYDGYDVGTQISTKAKQLVSLLTDKDRLQNERTKMLAAKRTFAKNTGITSPVLKKADEKTINTGGTLRSHSATPTRQHATKSRGPKLNINTPANNPHKSDVDDNDDVDDDVQLKLALAISKEEYEREKKERMKDDLKFQLALQESKIALENANIDIAWGINNHPKSTTATTTTKHSADDDDELINIDILTGNEVGTNKSEVNSHTGSKHNADNKATKTSTMAATSKTTKSKASTSKTTTSETEVDDKPKQKVTLLSIALSSQSSPPPSSNNNNNNSLINNNINNSNDFNLLWDDNVFDTSNNTSMTTTNNVNDTSNSSNDTSNKATSNNFNAFDPWSIFEDTSRNGSNDLFNIATTNSTTTTATDATNSTATNDSIFDVTTDSFKQSSSNKNYDPWAEFNNFQMPTFSSDNSSTTSTAMALNNYSTIPSLAFADLNLNGWSAGKQQTTIVPAANPPALMMSPSNPFSDFSIQAHPTSTSTNYPQQQFISFPHRQIIAAFNNAQENDNNLQSLCTTTTSSCNNKNDRDLFFKQGNNNNHESFTPTSNCSQNFTFSSNNPFL